MYADDIIDAANGKCRTGHGQCGFSLGAIVGHAITRAGRRGISVTFIVANVT